MTYDARYAKRWHYERSHGITQSVPVDKARARINSLMAAGFSAHAIAVAAGVSSTAILDTSGAHPARASRTINRRLSARIVALNVNSVINAQRDESTLVPAVGAKRRVQALLALGHTFATIDAQTGHRPRLAKYVMDRTPGMSITLDKYRAIERAYAALWNVTGENARIRNDSRRRGYATPLAWDDNAIDDPNAEPAGMDSDTRGSLVDNIEFILEHEPYATTVRLTERLGYTHKTAISNALKRAGRDDLLAQLARNAEVAS